MPTKLCLKRYWLLAGADTQEFGSARERETETERQTERQRDRDRQTDRDMTEKQR